MLPQPQGAEMLALWQEFESAQHRRQVCAGTGPLPFLANVFSEGGPWTESSVSMEHIFEHYRKSFIKRAYPVGGQ